MILKKYLRREGIDEHSGVPQYFIIVDLTDIKMCPLLKINFIIIIKNLFISIFSFYSNELTFDQLHKKA